MGASGFTTTLFGFVSVATFLYVSLSCDFIQQHVLLHELSSGLTGK